MKVRTVIGPVVVLPDATTGKTAYYYQGAVLPDGLNEDRVAGVIADGLVSEEDRDEAVIDDDVDTDDQVPDGTADEVLAWVGSDPERAKLALAAEQAGQKRSTLTDKLTKLAEAK